MCVSASVSDGGGGPECNGAGPGHTPPPLTTAGSDQRPPVTGNRAAGTGVSPLWAEAMDLLPRVLACRCELFPKRLPTGENGPVAAAHSRHTGDSPNGGDQGKGDPEERARVDALARPHTHTQHLGPGRPARAPLRPTPGRLPGSQGAGGPLGGRGASGFHFSAGGGGLHTCLPWNHLLAIPASCGHLRLFLPTSVLHPRPAQGAPCGLGHRCPCVHHSVADPVLP